MKLLSLFIALLYFSFIPCAGANGQASDYVWWEGESPESTNFPKESWFSANTLGERAAELSGGQWLSVSGKRGLDELFANYKITVHADGEYNLWTRKFWRHGPFKWRFDKADYTECSGEIALADDTFLRQYVNANWVYLGKVKLTKGEHAFDLRLLAKQGQDVAACFDCFLMIPGTFTPDGKRKPGEKSGKTEPGYFAFEPDLDPFKGSPIDLRDLNEKVAGQSGFLRRDGDHFQLGDGKTTRFWAVNVHWGNAGQDRASVDYLARKLAKLGVNMVRFHDRMFDINEDPTADQNKRLDDLFYLVNALKQQGIYTKISLFYPIWYEVKPGSGINGFDSVKSKNPFGLLYFNPELQALHRARAKWMLDTENPYTGLTLAQDPSVGIVEIVNEDSLFFWTFHHDRIPPAQWAKLETLYATWLEKRYGSVGKALSTWGKAEPDDDPRGGRVVIYDAWHMTADGVKQGGDAKRRRVGDQVRFLAELQHDFYAAATKYLKDDLHVGGLVSASNWIVSDPSTLEAIERYTYTPADVMDRHGYFGGKHEGEGAGFSVRIGHIFEDLAAVKTPEALPIMTVQIEGYPQIISELGWTNPNRFRSDATFLTSAYSALQGTDGVFFFSMLSNTTIDKAMNKFGESTPMVAGTFPAAALMYRRGDVKEAEPAVYQKLSLDDLFAMKGSGAVTPAAFDELRKADLPAGGVAKGSVATTDPLACYVGRVVRGFGADTSGSYQVDLSKFIDRSAKTIRSQTNELQWNYGQGIAKIQTPRAQGAAGFLSSAGKIDLGDVTIESGNEFVSVIIIALDDQPLAASKRILIQAATEEKTYGFKVEGNKITDVGGAPYQVKKIDVTVTLKSATGGATVQSLDLNGYSGGATQSRAETGVIKLAENALYTLVQR